MTRTAHPWRAPDWMPSRRDLQPPPHHEDPATRLPHDFAALVRAGHVTEVAPGVYRRAPHRTATMRQQYDGHVNRLAAAVHDHDDDAALHHHTVGRGGLVWSRSAGLGPRGRLLGAPCAPLTGSTLPRVR